MPLKRFRYSLGQVLLVVALAAILVPAAILLWQGRGDHSDSVTALEFSPDGEKLAVCCHTCRYFREGFQPVGSRVATDASQEFVLLNTGDLSTFHALDRTPRSNQVLGASRVRTSGQGDCLAFSPDGKTLATNGLDRGLVLWDVGSGQQVRALTTPEHSSGSTAWASDGTLATASRQATYLVDTRNYVVQTFKSPTESLALSRDGARMALSLGPTVEIVSTHTGQLLLQIPKGPFTHFDRFMMCFSPKGDLLAVGVEDSKVRVWDTATGKVRYSWDVEVAVSSALAFSPEGATLAVADGSVGVRLFHLGGQAPETILVPQQKTSAFNSTVHVTALAYSPDGKFLAIGNRHGKVFLWDVSAKQIVRDVSLVDSRSNISWVVLTIAGIVWLALWVRVSQKNRSSRVLSHPPGP